MKYNLCFLDGNRNFKFSLWADKAEQILSGIEREVQNSHAGFHEDNKDFMPLEYQIAQVHIFNTETDKLIGRWGRNTGMVWYDEPKEGE